MKKTYLDALMSIFTPIPLNNGFYFVDNNGTIDWILSNIFLLGYVLPVEGVMIGIFFYLLLSHAIEHKTQLMFREKFKLVINLGNYILIYTNYVKTLHYICILCKKLLY